MATIPDVNLTGVAYQDLYSATGIASGSSVTIQNKAVNAIYIQNIATQPAATSQSGLLLKPYEVVTVTGAIDGLWAMGVGPACVEAI